MPRKQINIVFPHDEYTSIVKDIAATTPIFRSSKHVKLKLPCGSQKQKNLKSQKYLSGSKIAQKVLRRPHFTKFSVLK